MHMNKIIAAIITTCILFTSVLVVINKEVAKAEQRVRSELQTSIDRVGGYAGTISNFNSFSSSSAVTVGTGSTLVTATNTARVALQLSNLANTAVYCNLRRGAAATIQSGLTIFASSTMRFNFDELPYTGAVYCIGHQNSVVTVLEEY
jgi:hypothetical protein